MLLYTRESNQPEPSTYTMKNKPNPSTDPSFDNFFDSPARRSGKSPSPSFAERHGKNRRLINLCHAIQRGFVKP